LVAAGDRLCEHSRVVLAPYPPVDAESGVGERKRSRPLTVATVLVSAAAVAAGVASYRVQVDNFSPHSWAAATVAYSWAFVLAGLVAWLRRPANRLGPLMVAAGAALLMRQFRYSHHALTFTAFFLLGDLAYAFAGHAILAYPSGRVTGRGPRLLVKTGYVMAFVFPLAVLLLHDRASALLELGPIPRRSLLVISTQTHAVELVQKAYIMAFYGILASLLLVVIVQRLVQATPRGRRMLAPLVLAAMGISLRAVWELARTFINQQPLAYPFLFWWQVVAFIAIPIAMLVGMLRSRLARANVSRLVLELDRQPATPGRVRDALARALADPTLDLLFWLPEQNAYVDTGGSPVSPPAETERRAVTRLEQDGTAVAAVVHDPSLLDEPELVESAGTAARLALENARLHAETRAQLQQVRESRRRIVTAADEERRRIERNLHDSVQQRLLAVALKLSSSRRQADLELDELIGSSVVELQQINEELRTLARGLHPTVLTEYGLVSALTALTSNTPLPVTVDVSDDRLPLEVEAAAYYVASEALNNIVKHAGAEHATISAHHEGDMLLLEIADDGVGGATPDFGLQGIADRVEALGGSLLVDSPAGQGTRITVEIPCES
jgi:signal transduction histidine kinase